MFGKDELMAFVGTSRPGEAKAFYRDVLGLTLIEDSPFALVFNANGTMLRVQKMQKHEPAQHTALGWRITDMAAAIEKLSAAGVVLSRFDGLPQDSSGVWVSPDGHKIAWFCDPDGNTLSMTEFRPG